MTAADFVNDLVRGHLSSSVNWRANVPPVPMEATRPDRLAPVVKRFFDARLEELRDFVQSLRAEDMFETWTHYVASFDTPVGTGEAPRAEDVKATDTLTVAMEFPLRYVRRTTEGLVSLYYLDNRIDLRITALPFIKEILKRSSFPAGSAAQWLDNGFQWQDVKPVLMELVRAGVLRVNH
jgi:hypothetical protein